MRKIICLFIFVSSILACVPPQKKEITEVRNDLNDPIYRQILTFQDEQNLDSLFTYLSHGDPSYRSVAAQAFASFKEEKACDSLYPLLSDPIPEVRTSAAFALGQIGNSESAKKLINAFNTIDTLDANNETNTAILHAVGRCGDEESLRLLSTVTSYRPTDTLLLLGQAGAIYHFALRDITIPQGTERMVDFLSSSIYPEKVRLLAAGYTKRAKDIDLNNYKFRLNKVFQGDSDPNLKMDLAIALGKTADPDVLVSLMGELNKNNDYRVKINILRSLGNFTYINVIESVLEQLKNPNIQIAKTAADFLINHGQPNDVIIYRKHAKQDLPWQVKSKIYEAIIKHVPTYFSKTRAASLYDIRKGINSSSDPYEKAAFINALSYDLESLPFLKTLGFDANEFPARTTAAEGLNRLIKRKDLEEKMNKYQFRRFRIQVAEMIKLGLESEDAGMIALAAIGFRECSFDLKEDFEELSFIENAKSKLELPLDVEAYNEILKLQANIQNKEYKAVEIGFNHPIDWAVFDKLSTNSKAIVETNRGSFTIQLLKNNAPGSVINFIQLAEKGYYEGKRFHRVVPNFVIQTGCSRGDGWGGLEYSIRSELSPLNYDEAGFVGMASAGNHTESSQWFVTHSPSQHLNGNYTIFGKVLSGMETVHSISVGDILQSVKIQY